MLLQVGGWYVVPGYAVGTARTWLLGRREETHGWRHLHRQVVPAARSRSQQVWKPFQTIVALSGRNDQTLWSEAARQQRAPRQSLDTFWHEDRLPLSPLIACYSSLLPLSNDREALPSYPPNARVLEYLRGATTQRRRIIGRRGCSPQQELD